MMARLDQRALTTVALILGLVAMLALPIPAELPREMHGGAEHILATIASFVAGVAEFFAIVIITVGMLRAAGRCVSDRKRPGILGEVRMGLARSLTLALEFTIASDILRTAIAPSRQALATLATIVLLRTLLTHFLGEELSEEAGKPAEEATP